MEFKYPEEGTVPTGSWQLKPKTIDGFKELQIVGPDDRIKERFDAETTEEVASAEKSLNNFLREQGLRDALKYESDELGICVGKCDQYPEYYKGIISGDKRIFSLRDAKGRSHATIETNPASREYSDLIAHLGGDRELADDFLARGYQARQANADAAVDKSPLWYALELAGVPSSENIIQVKGTRNERPLDKYQQYITDFIKSGKFGNIGDIGHTDIVQLPDGRIITKDQYAEGMKAAKQALGSENISDIGLHQLVDWDRLAPHFQGYAIGGRVSPERCFCHNPLSVR